MPYPPVLDTVKGKQWYQADDVAEEYESKRFSRGGHLIDRRERQAVLAALAPVEGKRILEIACGTGRFTAMLAEEGADIVGIDISTPMLRQGLAKAAQANPSGRINFARGDAGQLPFPDDQFDAVFAMRFFHLAPSPDQYLAEMRRVSNGTIFFDTFNSFSSRSLYNSLLPMGSRLYTDEEVRQMLAGADLELRQVDHDFILPYGCYRSIPDGLARPLRSLDRRIGRSSIGDRLASVSYWQAEQR